MLNSLLTRARFFGSVMVLYSLTLLLIWQGAKPFLPELSPKAEAEQSIPANFDKYIQVPINIKSGVPIRISIPAIDIDRPILPGNYNEISGIWELSDGGIHFAAPSSPVNDYSGNSLIYGHNSRLVLGKLVDLKQDDKVQIITDNNLKFTYSLAGHKDSSPSDTTLFNENGPPTLILQTCSGLFNEIRSLYIFNLENVESL